jgi:DNA invertase Pin-like site-specific DNA recombinase
VGERAAIWRRVSSTAQDEANQIPDTERYCLDHGYEVVERYTVHAKSAYHGKQQKDLDRALNDMRLKKYTVLVVWHSDRLERRPGKALLDLLAEFGAAGCRVESTQEPTLGKLDTGSQVTTFLAGLMNHDKSKHLSEQVKLSHDRIRTNGGNPGRAPWGYVSAGGKYSRKLVPTDEGRRLVPGIFERIADGESLRSVAAWLAEETGRTFWARRLAWLIRNPTYHGNRVDADGRTVHKCEPLVDSALWLRANKALTAKPGKRGPVSGESALLTSVAFCGPCSERGIESPLYRIRPRPGYAYYRCAGAGAGRKGCGNMVRLEEADARVVEWISMMSAPRLVPQLVEGDSHETELADILLELAELPKRDLTDAEEDAERARLRALRDELEGMDSTPDRIELVETGETIGAHFRSLDDAGKRAMLMSDGIKVYAWKPEGDRRFAPVAIQFSA